MILNTFNKYGNSTPTIDISIIDEYFHELHPDYHITIDYQTIDNIELKKYADILKEYIEKYKLYYPASIFDENFEESIDNIRWKTVIRKCREQYTLHNIDTLEDEIYAANAILLQLYLDAELTLDKYMAIYTPLSRFDYDLLKIGWYSDNKRISDSDYNTLKKIIDKIEYAADTGCSAIIS